MQHSLILPLVLVINIAAVAPASAAVKAGAPCKKVGAKSVEAGKTYTCV